MATAEQNSSGREKRWRHPQRQRHWCIWTKRLWHPSRWSLGVFTLAATGIIAAVGLIGCWVLWRQFGVGLVGADKSTTLFDLARSTVTLLGVLTVGGAAAVAYRRQQTLEQQHRIDQERSRLDRIHAQLEQAQEVRAERTDLHARYQQAAAQLGHEEPIIRVAGVYALEALATEWDRVGDTVQKDVCIDLLCGYLRSARGIMQPAQDVASTTGQQSVLVETEKGVRSTIATVIARHLHDPTDPDVQGDWSKHSYDFSGVHFQAAEFSHAHFHGHAKFAGAQFYDRAWFENARFHGHAGFEGARFQGGAEFDSASFHSRTTFLGTQFHGHAGFAGAQFRNPVFVDTQFHDYVGFDGAYFHNDTRFIKAQFYDAGFATAEFHGRVMFDGAQFYGNADFDGALFRRRAGFTGVHFHDSAVFDGAHFDDRASFSDAQFDGGTGFDHAHFHGSVGLEISQVQEGVYGALIASEYLTAALQRLGFVALLDSIDCDMCQEKFNARSVSM